MNRRTFFKTSAALSTAGVGLTAYTTIVEPHWLDIVSRELRIAGLPRALDGVTLAQVSDLHVCSFVDDDYLTHSLDRLAALKPGIVVFTGDFVTWETDRTEAVKTAQLERILKHFPRGQLATIGILGNHDYGETWKDERIATHISSIVSSNGIHLLRNEVLSVSGLDFIGIDDLWSGRADPRLALSRRTSDAAIAMCHNPDAQDELPWEGYRGWVLAGHTHGGQCKPPFLPPPLLPVKNRRYVSGEIVVNADRTLYISRGVGHLLQARFNARPEITVFTLRGA